MMRARSYPLSSVPPARFPDRYLSEGMHGMIGNGRKRMDPRRLSLIMAALGLALGAPVEGAAPEWEKQPGPPAETEFLARRGEDPQNHFLLNGAEGFLAGREFYQVIGDLQPFLWTTQPLLRFGTDRAWQSDSSTLSLRTRGGAAADGSGEPYAAGEIGWAALEGLRLHAGWEENGLYSERTFPARRAMVGPDKADGLAWLGGKPPFKSLANAGVAFRRRGGLMAAQYNQGWWWTTSPVTGRAYPWEGFNADLLYKVGEDFELNLVEQQWDSPIPHTYYKSHWRRSEITLGFPGSSEGAWQSRFEIGFQRRSLESDFAFGSFTEKTYPVRYRYRQDWEAPDSLPLRILSQGSLGMRERMFTAQHSVEFRETVGTHRPMQFLRGYYRRPLGRHVEPTEGLRPDTTWAAESRPGNHSRGAVAGAEYREVRKRFLVGIIGDYALEWELPLFRADAFSDSLGVTLREGRYRASQKVLSNASGRVFASGGFAERATWRAQAGLRGFWGHHADSMEYRPSPWWAGAGAGWAFPTKTRLDAQVDYLGPKEVRGWGPVFEVPAHWENRFSLTQTFSERVKASLSALHAFGENIREHPNGNPLRFRLMGVLEGAF